MDLVIQRIICTSSSLSINLNIEKKPRISLIQKITFLYFTTKKLVSLNIRKPYYEGIALQKKGDVEFWARNQKYQSQNFTNIKPDFIFNGIQD